MSTSRKRSRASRARADYHHGDLRRALVAAASEMLEQDGLAALSLREAARRAGVSHNAPYRHFDDRQALLAAVAAEGFRRLADQMEAAAAQAVPDRRLREIGVAYVCFATAHPALFNLMFGRALDGGSYPELQAAGERAFAVLAGEFDASEAYEASEAPASGQPEIVAAWSVVHGLAHLLIDARLGPRLTGGIGDASALARAVLAARGGGGCAETIPILPSRDFDETSRFYAALDFSEVGRWPKEYLILKNGTSFELHFWHNPAIETATNDVSCYIRFSTAEEARAVHERWKAKVLPGGRLHSPAETDYGLLEFALIDPHGNLIRVGGRL